MPSILKRIVQWAARALIVLVIAQISLTLAAGLHPTVELAAHFSMHALVTAFFVLPLALWLRQTPWIWLAALGLMLSCWITQPWQIWWKHQVSPSPSASTIKVLSWNVLNTNRHIREVSNIVHDEDPDVLVLLEVRPGFLEELGFLKDKYPFSLEQESWGGAGIAVFSRQRASSG